MAALTNGGGTSRLSMQQTSNILLQNSEYILEILLPDGKVVGQEYTALNPKRDDQEAGSFKINIKTGVWSDFADDADDAKGGDVISLVQYIGDYEGKSSTQARRAAHAKCNALIKEHGLANGKSIPKKLATKPKKGKLPTEVISEDNLKVLPPDCDMNGNQVSDIWEYRNTDNDIVFYVARFDLDDGSKETKPVRYAQEKWNWSYPAGKRPLLNCQSIKPGSRVIFSEGEKTCTHLMQFKAYVSVTSSGGSGRLFESDLEPLQQAVEVIIFSDADEPGSKYASQIIGYCVVNEIPVKVLDVDALGWKDGEDAADFDLIWTDYESKIIFLEDWKDSNSKLFDTGVLQAAAQMELIDFDRAKDHLTEVLGIGKRTLDAVVKPYRETKYIESEQEEEDPEPTPEELEAYRQLIYPDIAHIAESIDILSAVRDTLHTMGMVGEEDITNLTYLAVTSRVLKKPINTLVKGSSSSGKSFTTQSTIKLFPDDAFYTLSGGSAKSLIYTQEDFEHRILVILEATQLNGASEDDSYSMFLRTLISEGHIKYETVEKNEEGELETRVIEKKGPTGLILTTTADVIHHENETRMLSVYSDESAEQTKAIMTSIAQNYSVPDRDEEIDHLLDEWHKYHEWVSLSIHDVVIPFMPKIMHSIEHTPVRFRRDITQLGSLIQTSAIMHQANRIITEDGHIVATLEDYETARKVITAALTRESEVSATPKLISILKCVYEHMPDEVRNGRGTFKCSTRKLSKELGIPQQTISYQLKKAVRDGYLKNTEMFPGRPMKLKLGDEFSEDLVIPTEILPNAEKLN